MIFNSGKKKYSDSYTRLVEEKDDRFYHTSVDFFVGYVLLVKDGIPVESMDEKSVSVLSNIKTEFWENIIKKFPDTINCDQKIWADI